MSDEIEIHRAEVDRHIMRREGGMPVWALAALAALAFCAYAFLLIYF